MDRARSDVSAGLLAQVWYVLREEPLELLRYFFDTARLFLHYIAVGGDRRPPFARRCRIVHKILQVNLRVPGAVPPLDCLALAEGLWSSPAAGAIVEVGVFKGRSTALLSDLAAARGQRMISIDTFAGLPEGDATSYRPAAVPEREYRWEKGEFAGSRGEFDRNVSRYGVSAAVTVVVSDVRAVAAIPLRSGERVSFCFFDVDLLSSYRGCIEAVARQLAPGAQVYVHEGALSPIRELLLDATYWSSLGLPAPEVRFLEETAGFRTNMTALHF